MRRLHWLVGLAAVTLATSPVQAQVLLPVTPFPFGIAPLERSLGIHFGHHGHHGFNHFRIYGPGYNVFDPWWGPSFQRIYISYVAAPPVVIVPQPVVIVQPVPVADDLDMDVIMPRRRPMAPAGEVEPDLFGPAQPPKEAPKPKAPAARARADRPPPRPKDQEADQLALGEEAFAAREYGRAERHFKQATLANPDRALAYFLLAQAQFALAKYAAAVAAIQTGLELQSDWPNAPFRTRALYGARAADFPEHQRHLEEVVGDNPDDPILLFLLGYEIWFDGRQDDARIYFQRAAAVAPDRTSIDRFLRARPGGPIARGEREVAVP